VGSQYLWDNDPPEPWIPLCFELAIPVNRFFVSETISKNCLAFFYTNEDDSEAGGRPVIYTDNLNQPYLKRTINESLINFRVTPSNPKGWRSGSFMLIDSIPAGSYIWFGCFAEFYWFCRFDYGAKCYLDSYWGITDYVPSVYPIWNANHYYDFKLSMYFTYSSSQNYVRTITQGVTLTDSRKLIENHKRTVTQTAGVDSLLLRYKGFVLKLQETVKGIDSNYSLVLFLRSLHETVKNTDTIKRLKTILRKLHDTAVVGSVVKNGRTYFTKITDTVYATGSVFRGLILFVRIITGVFVRDYLLNRFLKAKAELVLKSCATREIVLESRIN
jgi:hypothetical protein